MGIDEPCSGNEKARKAGEDRVDWSFAYDEKSDEILAAQEQLDQAQEQLDQAQARVHDLEIELQEIIDNLED